MGAKVADTNVARPGATSEFVLLGCTAGTGAGVGEAGGEGRDGADGGGATMISGKSGAAVTLLSPCDAVVKPTVPSCGVRGLPYWAPGPVLGELSGGEVDWMVFGGVVVFRALFWEAETLPGAGAAAGLRE